MMTNGKRGWSILGAPVLMFGVMIALGVGACRAPETYRLGYIGEFCGSDEDCQADPVELICVRSTCQDPSVESGEVGCRQVCDRLINECGRTEDDCRARCERTLEGWSQMATDIFVQCSLGEGDTPLSCETAREEDAPQFCYDQIPLAVERQERCDQFIARARDIGTANDQQLTDLRSSCYQVGRTRPASVWSETDTCAADDLSDAEFIDCVNMVLDVNVTGP